MLTELATRLARSVKPLDDIAAGCEAILLAIVVRLATWGASIPNAVLVAQSAAAIFGIGIAWGFVIAVSLELIGHSLIEHWQDSRGWNATKRKSDPAAGERLALALVIGYFGIDLAMVGALSLAKFQASGDWRNFITLAYPLIGIGVAIATDGRARLFRLRQAVALERQEAAEARKLKRKQAETISAPAEPLPPREAAFDIIAGNPDIPSSELAELVGRSARMCRKYKREYAAETASNGNGHK